MKTEVNYIERQDTPVHGVKAILSDYLELTKPGLSLMSVVTALFGYFATPGNHSLSVIIAIFIGTAFAAGGAAALNQWLERDEDARMDRTLDRPIPSGRISPFAAGTFGVLLSFAGVGVLLALAGFLPALVAAATIATYVALYTPLKKVHWISTYVGAIPGALPPFIGATALASSISLSGCMLFSVLAAWQIPHFMAIAWLYKQDYIDGDFEMLSRYDESGKRVALHALIFAVVLTVICLVPYFMGRAHWGYALLSGLLGAWIIYGSIQFYRDPTDRKRVRRLFFSTLIFLPIYMVVFLVGVQG
ncbi:MAG: protoheme IX farnesyltransferase [Lentimonas sp.]|jgi:protoheme IX farnesyltransferase